MIKLVDTNTPFDEKTKKAYRAWLEKDAQGLIRVGVGFGIIAYIVNYFVCFTISGADMDALFLVHMAVTSTLFVLFVFSLQNPNFNTSFLIVFITIVTSIADSMIAHYLPVETAFWLVAAQTILALILTLIVRRLRDLIIVAILLFIIPITFIAFSELHSDMLIAKGFLLITAVAGLVLLSYYLEKKRSAVFKLTQELHYSATHDSLTCIYNRPRTLEALDYEVKKYKRFKRPVSVLCIDLDLFKSVNDVYGHSAGDEVLKTLATYINRQVRDTDSFGRIGGEEFLVVLPETGLEMASDFAERLRGIVENKAVRWGDQTIAVTISIGVAQLNSLDDMTSLLSRGDHALYCAKDNGRNCVKTEDALIDSSYSHLREVLDGADLLRKKVSDNITAHSQNVTVAG